MARTKPYRLKKEEVIGAFFEARGKGNTREISTFSKERKNSNGHVCKQGQMSPSEAGQLLKRLHYVQGEDGTWYPSTSSAEA